MMYINWGIRNWHREPTPWHGAPSLKVVVAKRGDFNFHTREHVFRVASRMAAIIPREVEHRFSADGACEILVIIPPPDKRWTRIIGVNEGARILRLGREELQFLDTLHGLCIIAAGRKQMAFKHSLAGLAEAWMSVIADAGTPRKSDGEDPLREARLALATHCAQPLRIGELARKSGMAESVFRRRYRLAFGKSPKRDLLDFRLKRARSLLASTGLTLAEVALRSGFCDEHEFSRCFQKHAGKPPGKWRRERVLAGSFSPTKKSGFPKDKTAAAQ